ncbi:MAG: adenylyltransferase/cytidyltransferase family protein [Halioglobus sp.]
MGHLRLLNRARSLGDRLIVGVSTDHLNVAKKGRPPVYDQHERIEIVASLKCVDGTFFRGVTRTKGTVFAGKCCRYSGDGG